MSERGLRQLVINFMHIINLSAFWRVGQIAHKVPLLSLAHGWAGEAEACPGRQTSASCWRPEEPGPQEEASLKTGGILSGGLAFGGSWRCGQCRNSVVCQTLLPNG